MKLTEPFKNTTRAHEIRQRIAQLNDRLLEADDPKAREEKGALEAEFRALRLEAGDYWCCGCKKHEPAGNHALVVVKQILWPQDDGTWRTLELNGSGADRYADMFIAMCPDCFAGSGVPELVEEVIEDARFLNRTSKTPAS